MMKSRRSFAAIGVIVLLMVGVITAVFADTTYVVQNGDTLNRIALSYNTTWQILAEANNIVNPDLIYVGQVLTIPETDTTSTSDNSNTGNTSSTSTTTCAADITHTVQVGDTLLLIAIRYNTTWQNLAQVNNLANPNLIYVGQQLSIPGTCSTSSTSSSSSSNTSNTDNTVANTATPIPTGVWPTPVATPLPTGVWPTATPVDGVEAAAEPTTEPATDAIDASATVAPTAEVAIEATAEPTAEPTVEPTATTAPVVSGNAFMFGGQTHTLANPDTMKEAGMGWVKFQHKYSAGEDPSVVQGRIENAQAQGLKVLLSIPGADHSNIDYGNYVTFLRGVASYSPDAIEVWNEMNIDREWPAGEISGSDYVTKMLKPAYENIKAVNSDILVISGAPAPTGFFNGCSGAGCDDQPYLEAMASAGGANYLDCVGIHYNEGILSPLESSGDPRGNPNHYTRYYSSMVATYYNAFAGQKPLCFTELGYLSGEDFDGVPPGFAWAGDTSVDEHAQWLGEAARLAKEDGRVDMLIIFNVDFDLYEPNGDPQAGFAMVRPNGSCPACATLKAAVE